MPGAVCESSTLFPTFILTSASICFSRAFTSSPSSTRLTPPRQPQTPPQQSLPTMTSSSKTKVAPTSAPSWHQAQITLKSRARGCHIITQEVLKPLSEELRHFEVGLLNVFLCHTSASLQINENYSSDVPVDMESAFNRRFEAFQQNSIGGVYVD